MKKHWPPITITAVKHLSEEYPPRSGTQQRTYFLYKYLPAEFETRLVTYAQQPATIEITPTFRHIRFTLPSFLKRLEHWLYKKSVDNEYAFLPLVLLVRNSCTLRTLLKTHAADRDILISELPYLVPLLRQYRKKVLVYHAHDVELLLRAPFLAGVIGRFIALPLIRRAERAACRTADTIIAVSREDTASFQRLYGVPAEKIKVVPNGVDTATVKPASPDLKKQSKQLLSLPLAPTFLFMGSDCAANRQAAQFIEQQLVPRFPNCTFLVAGGVASGIKAVSNQQETFSPLATLVQSERTYGYGWYGLEYWKGGRQVRWTKERFGLHTLYPVEGVLLTCFSPVRSMIDIFIRGKRVASFTASKETTTHTVSWPVSAEGLIEFRVRQPWRPWRDQRKFGINISSVSFLREQSTSEAIALQSIENSVMRQHGNIISVEDFDDHLKHALLAVSDIALNPVSEGSGSNVKMMEYMAAGLPIVTTAVGARGIEGHSRHHYIVSTLDDFADSLASLLDDPTHCSHLGKNARVLACERYDWCDLSQQFATILTSSLTS